MYSKYHLFKKKSQFDQPWDRSHQSLDWEWHCSGLMLVLALELMNAVNPLIIEDAFKHRLSTGCLCHGDSWSQRRLVNPRNLYTFWITLFGFLERVALTCKWAVWHTNTHTQKKNPIDSCKSICWFANSKAHIHTFAHPSKTKWVKIDTTAKRNHKSENCRCQHLYMSDLSRRLTDRNTHTHIFSHYSALKSRC